MIKFKRNKMYILLVACLSLISVVLWSNTTHNHTENNHINHDTQNEIDLHKDHTGHIHDNHNNQEVHLDHSGHDHDNDKHPQSDNNSQDHEEDDLHVDLSKQAMLLADIELKRVVKSSLLTNIELAGEIVLNEERLVKMTPRHVGLVKSAEVKLGDYVYKGQTLARIESNESLTSYEIKAPLDGQIIDKDLNVGEYVGEEQIIFSIADLSTVWVDCKVYPNTIKYLELGQTVTLQAVGNEESIKGKISYISPIFDSQTRSSIARIEIPSQNMLWRPGMFIYATIMHEFPKKTTVVTNEAVQLLHDQSIVFIRKGDNSFEPVQVEVGISDDNHTEILAGLNEGDLYVAKGAFEIKAELVTSSLGDHAGHGH
jgi:cobalt-zinc-cadmium efflux system membrane fusion protein